jgi:hypothetical protein
MLELPRISSSRFALWQCHERHICHSTRRRIGTAVGSLRGSGEEVHFGEKFRFRSTEELLKLPEERVPGVLFPGNDYQTSVVG